MKVVGPNGAATFIPGPIVRDVSQLSELQMRTVLIAAAVLMALPLQAQSLADRIAAVGTGTVRMQFASREGVCGNGRGNISIRHDGDRRTAVSASENGYRTREWEDECERGPVRLAVDVRSRAVVGMRAYVGGRWRGDAELDLGEVDAVQASRWLVTVAQTADAKTATAAIFPSMLAAGNDPWRQMLDIAKNESRPREVRSSATFWVAQSAEAAATRGLQEIVDTDGDGEVRKQAVFALSQRPKDESVPALIRVARTHRDPEIRRSAIFWLGQSRDPRALQYFEDVLLSR